MYSETEEGFNSPLELQGKLSLGGMGGTSLETDAAQIQPLGTQTLGSNTKAAPSNHVHAHGNQLGGTLHANAVAAGAAGFMTGADKTKLDGVEALADVTANHPPQAHVHANAIAAGAAGFLTGADKTKLDSLSVPVTAAQGGTGADLSSAAANRFVASPDNASGAVTLRALVNRDLPDGVVSGKKMAASAFISKGFPGRNGAGAITIGGGAVGDQVLALFSFTDGTEYSGSFESVLTVVNQIQQSDVADLSAKKFLLILLVRSS